MLVNVVTSTGLRMLKINLGKLQKYRCIEQYDIYQCVYMHEMISRN